MLSFLDDYGELLSLTSVVSEIYMVGKSCGICRDSLDRPEVFEAQWWERALEKNMRQAPVSPRDSGAVPVPKFPAVGISNTDISWKGRVKKEGQEITCGK